MKPENKPALTAGKSSGFGLAAARLFLDEGAHVAVAGRNLARFDAATTRRWMKLASLLGLALVAALTLQSSAVAQTASLDLLQRAANPNPTLQSYIASATLSAELHAPIPVHKYVPRRGLLSEAGAQDHFRQRFRPVD